MGKVKQEMYGDNTVQMPVDLTEKIKAATTYGEAKLRIKQFLTKQKFADAAAEYSAFVSLMYQAYNLNNIVCETYDRFELMKRHNFKDIKIGLESVSPVPHLFGTETYRIVAVSSTDVKIITVKFIYNGVPAATEHNRYVRNWRDS
jgi:hypothetical protein